MSNPVINRLSAEAATSDGPAITHRDVVDAALIGFALLLAGAVVGWAYPLLGFAGGLIALVVVIISCIRQLRTGPVLFTLYGLFEGMLLGATSKATEELAKGAVLQACLATAAIFAAVLWAQASGRVRTTSRGRKIAFAMLIGLVLFGLLNVILSATGVVSGMFGLSSGWLGIGIGVVSLALGAYFLVSDFEDAGELVADGAPRRARYFATIGILTSVVWIYVEVLRLIVNIRSVFSDGDNI